MKNSTGNVRLGLQKMSVLACMIFALILVAGSRAESLATASPFSTTVGVSYSRLFASNPLPVQQAMQQVKQNFSLVRFYDFDQELMEAAAAQGLQIVLTVPNEKLSQLDSQTSAQNYVSAGLAVGAGRIEPDRSL